MDLTEIIKGRRSIRKYKADPVPRDLLENIVDTAFWAPTGMNQQTWDIVVAGGETRDKIAKAVSNARERIKSGLLEFLPEKIVQFSLMFFENFGDAPVLILIYIPKVQINLNTEMDNEQTYHVERSRMTSMTSAAALAQNITLLAHEKGLGTCWMTDPKRAENEINSILGIEDKELVACMPIGYPDQAPPAPPRKEKVQWMDL